MWKRLLTLVIVLSACLCAWSADGDYFQASTQESVGKLIPNTMDVVLSIPEESVEAYKNASGWMDLTVMSASSIDGDTDWTEGQVVVDVESPGLLRMALLEVEEEEIRRLKICGSLNSADLQYLM